MSAKEALLLWAKNKTKGYPNVNVTNLHTSFQDGMAFCALIHKHRPDLIDFNKLDPNNPRENLKLAFEVAEQKLGIAQLLDVEDMLDTPKPDERAVTTYLALYYHAFAGQKKAGEAVDTLARVVDAQAANQKLKNDYEKRIKELKDWIVDTDGKMKDRNTDGSAEDINNKLQDLEDHKNSRKPPKAAEKIDIENLLNTLQMKLKNSNSPAYVPPEGLKPSDIDKLWGTLGEDEKEREAWLRDLLKKAQQQELLKNRFGDKAAALEKWIDKKQEYLGLDEEVDSLPVARSKLKTCEAFIKEHENSKKNLDEVNKLADDLINVNHPEKDKIGERKKNINDNWNGLKDLHNKKLDDLRKKVEREQLKEDTRLAFAKAAKEYANWVKKTQNDFIAENYGDSLEQVEAYKNKLDNSNKDFAEQNDSKKKHLDELWNKLQELGVTENRHTTYTNEDVKKFHKDLLDGLEKRNTKYQEELARQKELEELRKKFAKLADEFVQSIEQRKNHISSFEGEPDDIIPKVTHAYDEGKQEKEKLEEISILAAEMSKLGITSNKHAKFTLADLKVKDKQFGRWANNLIYQLGQERDLKAEYIKRAKAFLDWCEKTLPTLDKTSELDGTLTGIRNLRQKWNIYKTSDSAEQEIEKDTLHSLEKRIASILESTKRPSWTPPEDTNSDNINQKWEEIRASEKKTDDIINKELEKQEQLAVLVRRFNNDHSELIAFVEEKEQFFNENVPAHNLRDARLQNKLLQVNLEEVDFKHKRVDGLRKVRDEINEYKYPEIAALDEKLNDLENRWKGLTGKADEKKKGIASKLNDEEGKEKLRVDFAEAAKAFQHWAHDTKETVNDYNFGRNSEAVNAHKAELDKHEKEIVAEAEEKKKKLHDLDNQLKQSNVTDNKYTNLTFEDIEKIEDDLKLTLGTRQKAYASEVDKHSAHDTKRKRFAELAEKFIKYVQEKKDIFEKLEGTPEEKITSVNKEYQGGEPNKKFVDEISALASEMAKEGIHGNEFTNLSLPAVEIRNTQYNQSVHNFLAGLEEEKEFETRQKKQEETFKKREAIESLNLDYNTKVNILKIFVIESTSFLTESIVASSVTDVKELQQQVSSFEANQYALNHKLYDEILALHRQLAEGGSNVNSSDVTADWEAVTKLLHERKHQLEEEEKKQAHNDVLRQEFAKIAKEFSEWIEKQKEALKNESGELPDQLQYLSKLSESVTSEGNKHIETVNQVQQKLNHAQVTSNAFTDLTPATLISSFEALKDTVSKRQGVIDKEILRKKGQDVTPEELKEYKEVFQHFDKENKNVLDKVKFKAVLQTLGEDFDDERVSAIIKDIDTTRQDGLVSFDEFVTYMEKRKKKTDSKSEVVESFKSIAGGKEFITSGELYNILPKEKVDYLLTVMPKYKDMEDSYDYVAWANNFIN
jgi:Ca2+-binding EF-hand superfamily protein